MVFLITAGERKEARKGRQKVGVERREGKRREGKRKVSFLHFYFFPVSCRTGITSPAQHWREMLPQSQSALCALCIGLPVLAFTFRIWARD